MTHCTQKKNLTKLHCATFYQSALRYEQHEDVIPSFRVDSSEKGLQVVMSVCSDLPVKRSVKEIRQCLTFTILALVKVCKYGRLIASDLAKITT